MGAAQAKIRRIRSLRKMPPALLLAHSTLLEARRSALPWLVLGLLAAALGLAAFLLFCLTFAVNTLAEVVRLKLRQRYRYL